MRESEKLDIHQSITDKIIAALEAGVGEARLPWHRAGVYGLTPRNADTGVSYNGINVLSLWATAEARSYAQPVWATYRQWQGLGAQVRKGEKAALVVFYKQFDVDPRDDDPEDDGKRRVAKASWVFNAAQVDGYVPPEPLPPLEPITRIAQVESFVAATGAVIEVGGERAYYRRSSDKVCMPDENLFRSSNRTEDWYAIALHELGHWSGAPHRLNRQFGERFGDEAYAFEELVAELCSAFFCADLGISPAMRDDHATYIANWLEVLKRDNRAVFHAAAKASEAAKYLARFSSASLVPPQLGSGAQQTPCPA